MTMTPPTREELQAFRASMGWSLVRFAEEIGVARATAEKWEHTDPAKRQSPPPYLRLALRALAFDRVAGEAGEVLEEGLVIR